MSREQCEDIPPETYLSVRSRHLKASSLHDLRLKSAQKLSTGVYKISRASSSLLNFVLSLAFLYEIADERPDDSSDFGLAFEKQDTRICRSALPVNLKKRPRNAYVLYETSILGGMINLNAGALCHLDLRETEEIS